MKYCVRCGRILDDDEAFCGSCGLRQPYVPPVLLGRPASSPAERGAQPTPEARMAPSAPGAAAGVGELPAPYAPARRSGAVPCIVLGLVLFVLYNPLGTPLAFAATLLGLMARADTCSPRLRPRFVTVAAVLCGIAALADAATAFFLLFPLR